MKKYTMETWVGIFVVLCLACVAYLTFKLGKVEFFGEEQSIYYARFSSVSGLRKGSKVEMAGVEIGKVQDIRLDEKDLLALVELTVHKDVPISDDAIAAIKTAGLIGDKFIKITPGGSDDILKSGQTIIETQSALDIEDLISKYAFGSVK
jgi:phospholipid/cholesterol/gamma-HCH transport system substrate-binding protein